MPGYPRAFFVVYSDFIIRFKASKSVFKTYNILWNNIFHFCIISCIIPLGCVQMATRRVKIRKDEEYITLNVLLKITDLIPTGGMAKIFLAENDVYVNGEKENRRGRKLYRDDIVKANNAEFIVE